MLDLLVKNWKLRVWCSLFHFFHVICKISNFNIWSAKNLVQASCPELTLLDYKAQFPFHLKRNHFTFSFQHSYIHEWFRCDLLIFQYNFVLFLQVINKSFILYPLVLLTKVYNSNTIHLLITAHYFFQNHSNSIRVISLILRSSDLSILFFNTRPIH